MTQVKHNPAHIITHQGREYDLTALETPFGLLPDPVQEALKVWPHGLELYNCDETGSRGAWINAPYAFRDWHTVRVKPEPYREQVALYFGELRVGALVSRVRTDTHRITFDLVDGKPDCNSVKMEEI